jgi:polysaccharide biosynthesis/export protein
VYHKVLESPFRKPVLRSKTANLFGIVLACVLLLGTAATAKQAAGQTAAALPNDLTLDNLERVGASEAEITEALRKDPGMLVELKRWVAKDAADRGQILIDSDLADSAIFQRLASDQKLRAAATRLLQRYGYLVPKLNPESEQAHERDLFMQERVRMLAAAQERDQTNAATNANTGGSASQGVAQCATPNRLDCQVQREPEQPRSRPQPTTSLVSGPESDTPYRGIGSDQGSGNLPTNLADSDRSLTEINTAAPQRTTFGNNASTNLENVQSDRNPFDQNTDGLLPSEAMGIGIDGGFDSLSTSMPEKVSAPNPTLAPRPEKTGSLAARAEVNTGLPTLSAMVRHNSPYSDIPSLYDIYSHATDSSKTLERFGADIFRNAPEAEGTMPIDLPASPDYVVGPGDGLTIDLWGGVSQRLVRTVDREGRVSLPEVGPVLVSGKTLGDVQQNLQRVLSTQFHDISTDVSLSRLRTVRVYIVGDVVRPGAYDISSLSTPLNALLAANGPTTDGSLRVVKHYRGDVLVQQVDLYDLFLRGVRTDIQHLEPGDTLLVPPIGAQVQIDGMVRRPSIYELHGETTLAQALNLAGGILPTAALSHIEVQRLEAHQKKTMLSLDISETSNAADIETKLASFEIHDRDEIHIFPIATFNQDAVYLEGHVLRSGPYSYKPGMKLTDIISSYNDLLPEPATKYAEIVRLNPPDFRPSVESFDLAAALANPASAPKLQPLDTVRIFSRYDFENPPSVSVNGAVRHPGVYQTSGQIHFREAIQLAGGLTPDASRESAQIVQVMPDSSLKVLNVNLKDALEGDPVDNVLLQPRDRILIQENPSRVDPATVLIQGEVTNPGRYPLSGNLRVSDLIHLAGGFGRGAFTESADLTRFNVSLGGENKLGEHVKIDIGGALSNDPAKDLLLRDGDVLTIQQLSGWKDIGASVTLQGEVAHPGTYGIQPGERLSSVLKRAGGFAPEAYPDGAVFTRPEVRGLEEKSREGLLEEIRGEEAQLAISPDDDADKRQAKQAGIQQLQITKDRLQASAAAGRMVLRIGSNLKQWEGTPNDIVVRDGDALTVPKEPNFVLVYGAVYNETAITYRPGRSANWYLGQAGGPTQLADRKSIFVIRADGSIVGEQGSSLWGGNALSAALHPGDMVVVPDKALGPSSRWKSLMQTATTFSSVATSAIVASKF